MHNSQKNCILTELWNLRTGADLIPSNGSFCQGWWVICKRNMPFSCTVIYCTFIAKALYWQKNYWQWCSSIIVNQNPTATFTFSSHDRHANIASVKMTSNSAILTDSSIASSPPKILSPPRVQDHLVQSSTILTPSINGQLSSAANWGNNQRLPPNVKVSMSHSYPGDGHIYRWYTYCTSSTSPHKTAATKWITSYTTTPVNGWC